MRKVRKTEIMVHVVGRSEVNRFFNKISDLNETDLFCRTVSMSDVFALDDFTI